MYLHKHDDADIAITEGPGDGLTAYASGTDAVSIKGASLGTNDAVRSQLLGICQGRRVLLCGDNDRGGRTFNRTLGEWLTEQGIQVHVVKIHRGGDLNEWMTLAGPEWISEWKAAKRNAPKVTAGSWQDDEDPPPADDSVFDHPWLKMRRTDDHNGRAFVDYIGTDWTYCPAIGWLKYQDGAHRPDELDQVRHQLASMFDEFVDLGLQAIEEGEAMGDQDGEDLAARGVAFANHGLKSLNQPRFDHALKAAQTKRAVAFDDLDRHPYLLVAKNVTIDLRDGSTMPHDPKHWITHGIDAVYDPDAQCPQWDKFLLDITNNRPELADFLQVLIGYGITGKTSEQVLAVLVGSGSNGKTVFANVLRKVFDAITAIASFTAFEKKQGGSGTSDLAALAGARMVWASEGERQKPLAEALVKRVTGSDPITCRHLYKIEFTYEPRFLLMLGTNYVPNIGGQDLGIWRRLLLVPFDAVFLGEERDLFIEDKLIAEASGILRWACDGAKRWYADGLEIPELVRAQVATHKETSDSLAGFVGQIVTASPSSSPDDYVSGADIYEAFRDWAYQHGENQMSAKALFSAISERLPEVQKFKHRTGVAFRFCELNTEELV